MMPLQWPCTLYLHCGGIVCGDQGGASAAYAEIIPHRSAPQRKRGHTLAQGCAPPLSLTVVTPYATKAALEIAWRACRSIPSSGRGKAWTCLARLLSSRAAPAVSGGPLCYALLRLAPMW